MGSPWRFLPCERCCGAAGTLCGACDPRPEFLMELSGFQGICPGRCNLNGTYAEDWMVGGSPTTECDGRCPGWAFAAGLPWEPCYTQQGHPATLLVHCCFNGTAINAFLRVEGFRFPSYWGVLFSIKYQAVLPDPLPDTFDCSAFDQELLPVSWDDTHILLDPWVQQFPDEHVCRDWDLTRLRLFVPPAP